MFSCWALYPLLFLAFYFLASSVLSHYGKSQQLSCQRPPFFFSFLRSFQLFSLSSTAQCHQRLKRPLTTSSGWCDWRMLHLKRQRQSCFLGRWLTWALSAPSWPWMDEHLNSPVIEEHASLLDSLSPISRGRVIKEANCWLVLAMTAWSN